MTATPAAALPAHAPSKPVAVLGGGQLGRMFVHAAQSRGVRVVVLEPDATSPAGASAEQHLRAAYDDPAALRELAASCQGVTTEFENVPAAALQQLADAGLPVAPPAAAVRICQHRALEKQCFVAAGVPCAPHAVITAEADLHAPATHALLPGILKTATLGYDGKGQASVHTADELAAAWQAMGRVPCVLEQRLALAHEISVVVARAADGQCVHLPVQQNLHRDGILAVTQVPAPDVPQALCDQAVACAQTLAAALHYVGVLCVEFFVLADGSLVANEMAPRPHNSGHHSIDSCDSSQFDLQLRTLLGWPLVAPRRHSAAVMLNLLGDLWFDHAARDSAGQQDAAQAQREPPWPQVLALPGVHLHLYGKQQARRGRKMGHLTITAAELSTAQAVARQAAAVLGLPGF